MESHGWLCESHEDFEHAAARILKQLTGLKGYTGATPGFGDPDRDTMERTVS
jgi:ADP-ribose pyrophosphatase YjhB (NUDIX family)